MSGTVTEDYILGIEAKRSGFKSAFAAISRNVEDGLDFVATREFFPKTLEASIKQKTRWVYGINFEAFCKLGWTGDPWDFYFFLRDRKGMITSFLPPVSFALLVLDAARLRRTRGSSRADGRHSSSYPCGSTSSRSSPATSCA